MKYLLTTTFIFFFTITPFWHTVPALAGTEDLIVTKVTRITHEAYRPDNPASGTNPWMVWNRDHTRMLVFESQWDTHPTYGTTGRGWVWATIADWKGWTDLADYQAKVHQVPFIFSTRTQEHSIVWSNIVGEENIVYATLTDGWLVKIDLDAGTKTNWVYVNAKQGTHVYGYRRDNGHLILSLDNDSWSSGGYDVDLVNRTKTFISGRPSKTSTEWQQWPDAGSHGHSGKSPSGKLEFVEGGFASHDGVMTVPGGVFTEDLTWENESPAVFPWYLAHMSWHASENWFLANSYTRDDISPNPSSPRISTFKLWQVYYDGSGFTYRELLEQDTASKWTSYANWVAHFIATISRNGKMAIFTSTDGKYSYEDNQISGVTPWGYEGLFLVEFTTTSGGSPPDTTSPSTPTNLTATAISSSQINLSWSPSTDNTGVTGYKIYREGTQLTTTSNTSYSDTGLSPSTTYTYTASSYDAAGNNSSQSTPASATTQSAPPPPGQSVYTILKTTTSPTIDGNLSEYANANSITFSPATGGNTATVKALWNSQALYIGYEVTDTQLNSQATTRDSSVYDDDSVEWFIDTNNDDGGSQTTGVYMLSDDYHGIVNTLNAKYDSQGTTSGSPTSSYNGNWTSAVQLNGTNNNNTDMDTSYTVEIKIPWTSIGYTTAPTDNTIIAMSFAVEDKDSASFSYLMWPNITTSFENASKWRQVQLSSTTITSPQTLQGDLNQDSTVNALDWSIMNNAWGTADTTADLNNDGIVNTIDFSILNGEWGM